MPPWSRPFWTMAALLLAYFAFPLNVGSAPALAVGLVLTAVGLGVLARVMVAELQHLRDGAQGWSTSALAMVLVALVMAFSLTFYLVNRLDPEQISGLETRLDALYFTLSTMSTVGYGDIHAVGQLARALICGLIVFSVVVVASLVRAHTRSR